MRDWRKKIHSLIRIFLNQNRLIHSGSMSESLNHSFKRFVHSLCVAQRRKTAFVWNYFPRETEQKQKCKSLNMNFFIYWENIKFKINNYSAHWIRGKPLYSSLENGWIREYWHQLGAWPHDLRVNRPLPAHRAEIDLTGRVCCVYLLSLSGQLILELPDLRPLQLHLVGAVLAQTPAAVLQLPHAELVFGAHLSLQPLGLKEPRHNHSQSSRVWSSERNAAAAPHLRLSVSQSLLSLLQIRQSLLQLLLQETVLHFLKNNVSYTSAWLKIKSFHSSHYLLTVMFLQLEVLNHHGRI